MMASQTYENQALEAAKSAGLEPSPVVVPLHPIMPFLADLDLTLAHEREDLQAGRFDRLPQFAAEKMRALEQINLQRTRSGNQPLPSHLQNELADLKEKLEANKRELDVRIRAINEMTDTIQAAIDESESDGTYQAGSFRVHG